MKKKITPSLPVDNSNDTTNLITVNLDTYTLDDLLQVWYYGMINGATIQQFCQDNNLKADDGLKHLYDYVKGLNDPAALRELLKDKAVMLGLYCECSDIIIPIIKDKNTEKH